MFEQICPKKLFPAQNRRSQQHNWILHIPIRIKLFLDQACLKIYFRSKTEKLKTTIESERLEIVWKWFWCFGPNLPKKGISGLEQGKWTPSLNSAYLNQFRCPISALIDNFNFLDQICPKRVFPAKNRKSEHHHWILHARIRESTKF